jgi:DNA-directed RNA polymerase specialized sigma24 family protein
VISLPEHDQQTAEDVGGFARRCGLELLRFAYLLCGDRQRAEDLLQDVLLAMHRRFPDVLTVDNPVGYARRALANANVSRARRASSSEVVVDEFPDAAVPDGSDPAERDALW